MRLNLLFIHLYCLPFYLSLEVVCLFRLSCREWRTDISCLLLSHGEQGQRTFDVVKEITNDDQRITKNTLDRKSSARVEQQAQARWQGVIGLSTSQIADPSDGSSNGRRRENRSRRNASRELRRKSIVTKALPISLTTIGAMSVINNVRVRDVVETDLLVKSFTRELSSSAVRMIRTWTSFISVRSGTL